MLRSGSRRWPPKYETLNAAKTEKKVNKATGRLAQHYQCNICKKEYTSKDIEVDHIKPIIDPKKGFIDWNTFVNNLFCSADNLQAVCKTCHKTKTQKEKAKKKK